MLLRSLTHFQLLLQRRSEHLQKSYAGYHKVRRGQNLTSIAKRYNLSVKELKSSMGLESVLGSMLAKDLK